MPPQSQPFTITNEKKQSTRSSGLCKVVVLLPVWKKSSSIHNNHEKTSLCPVPPVVWFLIFVALERTSPRPTTMWTRNGRKKASVLDGGRKKVKRKRVDERKWVRRKEEEGTQRKKKEWGRKGDGRIRVRMLMGGGSKGTE